MLGFLGVDLAMGLRLGADHPADAQQLEPQMRVVEADSWDPAVARSVGFEGRPCRRDLATRLDCGGLLEDAVHVAPDLIL